MSIIVVRTDYDRATKITCLWGERLRDLIEVDHDLHATQATENELRQILQGNPQGSIIAFYGHGTARSLLAQGGSSSLISLTAPGIMPKELTGMKIYAVACNAGKNLGPNLGQNKAEFIGYSDPFGYSIPYEHVFADIVNWGICNWSSGETSRDVVAALRSHWMGVKDDFMNGGNSTCYGAHFVALQALSNSIYVCHY